MKVSFIGSGNIATHLAQRLLEKGVFIDAIWSQSTENAFILAKKCGAKSIKDLDKMASSDIDFIFICTPDDSLVNIIEKLKDSSVCLIHCSGATGLSVFNASQSAGIIYPLQTFSKNIPLVWEDISLFLSSKTEKDREKIKELALLLSPKIYWISDEDKKSLHIAAVIACNFSNFLYGFSHQLLKDKNLPFSVLETLLKETLNKALRHPPFDVQTGPARRGDLKTIENHQDVLQKYPEILPIYTYISEKIKTHYDT